MEAPLAAFALAIVCGTITAGVIAWAVARYASAHHRESLALLLAEGRTHVERAAEEMALWCKRGSEERARVESADSRHRRKAVQIQQPEPRYRSVSEYKRALERGEPRDPLTEAQLQLGMKQ